MIKCLLYFSMLKEKASLYLIAALLTSDVSLATKNSGFDLRNQQRISLKSSKKNKEELQSFNEAKEKIMRGDLKQLVRLLDNGIVSLEDNGATFLRIAAQENKPAIIEALLSRGIDINARSDNTGFNALISACIYGQSKMVKFLINKGARVNDSSFSGSTPLMWGHEYKEIVRMLLSNGADINVKNQDGNTALSLAILSRKHDVVNLILERKPDLSIKDKQGRTAIDLARITGDKKIIRLVENAMK